MLLKVSGADECFFSVCACRWRLNQMVKGWGGGEGLRKKSYPNRPLKQRRQTGRETTLRSVKKKKKKEKKGALQSDEASFTHTL